MGMAVGEDAGGVQAEPNVVPMIDILLVLLIIFMMQVPLQRKAMDTQVPPVETREQDEEGAGDEDEGIYQKSRELTVSLGAQFGLTKEASDVALKVFIGYEFN